MPGNAEDREESAPGRLAPRPWRGTLSSVPNGEGHDDPALAALGELQLERLRARMDLLESTGTDELLADLRTARHVMDGLPQDTLRGAVLHPLFRRWWFQLNDLSRRKDAEETPHLGHLGRFLVNPARAQGLEFVFRRLPVSPGAELRFPGLTARVCLGATALAGCSQVMLRGHDGGLDIEARESGARVHVAAEALTSGGGAHPLVRHHAVIPGTAIELDASDPWTRALLARMNEDGPEPPYEERDLAPVDPAPPELATAFRRALDLIAAAWPELLAEIEAHVRLVVPFTGDAMGWTNVLFNGAVFIKAATDPLFLAERLAHEASHVRLYTIMLLERLHESPPSVRVRSPFRRDLRPVSGVYHAVFVYARLIELMLRLSDSAGADACRERGRRMVPVFHEGVRALRSVARLTPLGAALLEQAEERVAARAGGIA